MKKCGLTTVPVGNKMVPRQSFQKALGAVVNRVKKGSSELEALAEGFSHLPAGTDYKAFVKTYNDLHSAFGKDRVKGDDLVSKEASEETKDAAEQLADYVNSLYSTKRRSFTPSTAKLFSELKGVIELRSNDMTEKVANSLLSQFKSILKRNGDILEINKLKKNVKKNIGKKTGFSKEWATLAGRLLTINADKLNGEQADGLRSIMSTLGARDAELNLYPGLLDEAEAMAKQFAEEGDVQTPDVLKRGKYNTEERAERKKEALIIQIQDNQKLIDPKKFDQEQLRADVEEAKRFKMEDLDVMDNKTLTNISKGLENLKNGNNPSHEFLKSVRRIKGINSGAKIIQPIVTSKLDNFWDANRKFSAKIVSSVNRMKFDKYSTPTKEMIRKHAGYALDAIIGNNGGQELYQNIIEKPAQGASKLNTEQKFYSDTILELQSKLRKNLKSKKKVIREGYLMTAFAKQLEFESNPNDGRTASAIDFINKTLEFSQPANKGLADQEREILEDVKSAIEGLDDKSSEGIKSLLNKGSVDILGGGLDLLRLIEPKAQYAATNRGSDYKTINNYFPSSVMLDEDNMDTYVSDLINRAKNVGSEAGSIHDRQIGAKPINFDFFSNIYRVSAEVLVDVHVTPARQEVTQALKFARKDILENHKDNKQAIETIAAIEDVYEETTEKIIRHAFLPAGFMDSIFNSSKELAYPLTLADPFRLTDEIIGNIPVMIAEHSAIMLPDGNSKYFINGKGAKIADFIGSTVTNKLSQDGIYGSRRTETKIFKGKPILDAKLYSPAMQNMADMWNRFYNDTYLGMAFKGPKQLSKYVGAKLVSLGDEIPVNFAYYSILNTEFKKESGKELDFDKLEARDLDYFYENKEAIEHARRVADKAVKRGSSPGNPYDGVARYQSTRGKNEWKDTVSHIQGFMQSFYTAANTADIENKVALRGQDPGVSRARGLSRILAARFRDISYGVASAALLTYLVGDDEDWEEYKKDLGWTLLKNSIKTWLNFAIFKTAPAANRTVFESALEYGNREFLFPAVMGDFEEYNKYENSLYYDKLGDQNLRYGSSPAEFSLSFTGSPGVLYRPIEKMWDKGTAFGRAKPGYKSDKAWQEFKEEMYIHVPALLGYNPFYRFTKNTKRLKDN